MGFCEHPLFLQYFYSRFSLVCTVRTIVPEYSKTAFLRIVVAGYRNSSFAPWNHGSRCSRFQVNCSLALPTDAVCGWHQWNVVFGIHQLLTALYVPSVNLENSLTVYYEAYLDPKSIVGSIGLTPLVPTTTTTRTKETVSSVGQTT